MFESYMFVPANKKKFIEKSETLIDLGNRIFDLEDSVFETEFDEAIANLSSVKITKSDWVRIPIGKPYQIEMIEKINKLGINNYVIPKFEGYIDFTRVYLDIIDINKKARMILLIENAKSYIELEKILKEFRESIHGVSLGIHDFTFETGMRNDYKLLKNIRINIMLLGKAYSITPIDVVSIHLKDNQKLIEEILDGFNLGYRSKLLIHPSQLEILNKTEFYSLDEIKEFNEVLKYYNKNIHGKEALFSFNGRVYEKMHIEEIKGIIGWGRKFHETDW